MPSSAPSHYQIGQLNLHPRLVHHQPPSRLSLLRSLLLRLRIPRPQLPPLALALPSHSSDGNNNGGGGDGEAGDDDDGGASDGEGGEALFVLAQAGRKLEILPLLRWLLTFRGFRECLLADDLFLANVAMECGVGVIAKVRPSERRKQGWVNHDVVASAPTKPPSKICKRALVPGSS